MASEVMIHKVTAVYQECLADRQNKELTFP